MSEFSKLTGAHVGPSSSSEFLSANSSSNSSSIPPDYSPRTIPDGEEAAEVDESTSLLVHGKRKSSSRDRDYKSLQSFPNAFSEPATPSEHVHSILSKVWKTLTSTSAKSIWGLAAVLLLLLIVLQAMHVYWEKEFINATAVDIQKVQFEEFTNDGVTLRVRGELRINYTLIDHDSYRSWFLRTGAYPIHTLLIKNSTSVVSFKNDKDQKAGAGGKGESQYKHAVTALLPDMTINIRHNETTKFDIITNLTDFGSPGLLASIVKRILTEEEIDFEYKTALPIYKGIFPLGTWPFVIRGAVNPGPELGVIPDQFNLDDFTINPVPQGYHGLSVAAMISAFYNFSISAILPELRWKVFIPGCNEDEFLYVTDAFNLPIHLKPFEVNELGVYAMVKKLSSELNVQCPGSNHTAIDQFAQQYLSGALTKIKVQGSWHQPPGVPWWMTPILPLIELQIPIRGQKTDDKLIRELELSNFKITLPARKNPFEKPSGLPKLSAHIQATVVPPPMINMTEDVDLSVKQARGTAELFSSKGESFATVDIPDWLPCVTTTKMVDRDPPLNGGDLGSMIQKKSSNNKTLAYVVEFSLNGVPMNITDESVFSEVARQVIVTGSAPITLHAIVDADLSTPVGGFVFSDISIEGNTVIRA